MKVEELRETFKSQNRPEIGDKKIWVVILNLLFTLTVIHTSCDPEKTPLNWMPRILVPATYKTIKILQCCVGDYTDNICKNTWPSAWHVADDPNDKRFSTT